MNKLTRLIYVSQVSAPASVDLAVTVRDILRVSRANNGRAGVTGMLLTFGGYFVQALEGPDDQVRRTLVRVSRDDRHAGVKVLGADFCGVRTFEGWAMCANDLSAADDDILRVLDRRGEFLPYDMTAGSALKLLTSIAAIHTRQKELAG